MEKQFDQSLKPQLERESKILYEDGNNYTFLKCLDKACYKYYTSDVLKNIIWKLWWDDRDAELFFILDKTEESENPFVTPIVVTGEGEVICFFDNEQTTLSSIIEKYPNLKDVLYENLATNDTYGFLKRLESGVEFDTYSLSRIDESIDDIVFNKKNPRKSMIKLSFNYQDYISLFYPKSDDYWGDVSSFIMDLNRGYSNYTFTDYSQIETDWNEGYLVGNFNEENIKLMNQIGAFFYPSEFRSHVNGGENSMNMLCEKLSTMFSREISDIIDEFHMLDEDARKNGILEDVSKSFCNSFEPYGIFANNCMSNYVTTVNILISLYEKYKMQGFSIINLLKAIVDKNNLYGDDYQENYYDYYANFDNEQFNRVVSNTLSNILDKVEDNSEKYFTNIEEYRKLIDAVSKYGFNKWNILPSGDAKRFFIQDIDKDTNKVMLLVRSDKTGKVESRSYDLEGFNDFLHNKELFENKF